MEKYFGGSGVLIYLFFGFFLLLIGQRYLLPLALIRLKKREAIILALLTFLALGIAFALVYPVADSGVFGGGSDSDDAVEVAARALLNGQYPYYRETYLGGGLYFPGSILLSLPFALLGHIAYQNLFFLILFFLFSCFYLPGIHSALFLFWNILFCPSILLGLLVGSERIASGIYVPLFSFWAVKETIEGRRKILKWASAILLGISICSRANFLLLLPIIFSTVFQKAERKEAIEFLVLTGLGLACAFVPFFLYDPAAFWHRTVIAQADLLIELNHSWAFSGTLLLISTLTLSFMLASRPAKEWDRFLFLNCAAIQAFPVLSVVILSSLQNGKLCLFYSDYGLQFLFFSALAAKKDIFGLKFVEGKRNDLCGNRSGG